LSKAKTLSAPTIAVEEEDLRTSSIWFAWRNGRVLAGLLLKHELNKAPPETLLKVRSRNLLDLIDDGLNVFVVVVRG
jgi:hypothetical protein